MHTYLRAIGFSNIKKLTDLDKLLEIIMTSFTERITHKVNEHEDFVEITKYFCEGIGITIRGAYDENGDFHLEHYFPFIEGKVCSAKQRLTVSKKVDNTSFSCMCDDMRLGVSLIFYIQNTIEYMKLDKINKIRNNEIPIYLSALSVEGKILLPIEKNQKTIEHMSKEHMRRSKLIAEAKEGNQEAINNLTIEDIDRYAMIARRTRKEDVYTIVNTSFYPHGTESDNYAIIGTIIQHRVLNNMITKEQVYELLIECNELIMSVCINKNDLFGQPYVGARFKGVVWLQGKLDFNEIEEV